MPDQPATFPEFTDNAIAVLNRRYLRRDPATGQPAEQPDDMFRRVAQNLAEADARYGAEPEAVQRTAETFYGIMRRLDFLPNSPTLMNAGRPLQQLSACFVLPIADSLDSIFDKVKETALIHKSGGGAGFAFSRLRPLGDMVKSTTGVASGPTSFIRAFDTGTDVVKQGGTRRGANMAVLSCYHPDVMEFINSKLNPQNLQNFNISVGVDARFMEAAAGQSYDLINPRTGQPQGQANAAEVFDAITRNAWLTSDPGILFLDRINADNPNPQLGQIEATNPCGEQPLLPYESCNLGSINLLHMLAGPPGQQTLDTEKLNETARIAVHMLDNVIDMNHYPLEPIREMTLATRRIGVGIMGWADALIQMSVRYDSDEAVRLGETVMRNVREAVHQASRELAETRGCFPAWERVYDPPLSAYDVALAETRGCFPAWEQSVYASQGIKMRNSAPTTIAPTGAISIIAGVSSGIEPLFALAYTRNVMDNTRLTEINPLFRLQAEREGFDTDALMQSISEAGCIRDQDQAPAHIRDIYRTSHQIAPYHHVAMQAAFQRHTDNTVSKTINFPEAADAAQIAGAYRQAWQLGCKGITVYRDGSKDQQVLTAGACDDVVMHSLTRTVSLALRSGVPAEEVIEQLRGNTSCPIYDDGQLVKSSPDAVGIALQYALDIRPDGTPSDDPPPARAAQLRHRRRCPNCSAWAFLQSGCLVCISCGWSQC